LLTGGACTGLSAVGGIVTGSICHMLMAVLGVSVLLKTVPGAFNLMLLAGAAYIAWIGWSVLRSHAVFNTDPQARARTCTAVWRRSVLSIMLNPKAYLFTLAVLPQFLHPRTGMIWMQAGVLWVIIATTQIGVYGGVAVAAGKLHDWLAARSAAGITINRTVGTALILAALLTAWHGWRDWP
jgi:threonine/homoserine/homoserine lactone efflux protein